MRPYRFHDIHGGRRSHFRTWKQTQMVTVSWNPTFDDSKKEEEKLERQFRRVLSADFILLRCARRRLSGKPEYVIQLKK
jgi:G:T-mismatch repair DNA endonuclease (very short patch repair protein)